MTPHLRNALALAAGCWLTVGLAPIDAAGWCPAVGVAVAGLVVAGYRLWPAVLFGFIAGGLGLSLDEVAAVVRTAAFYTLQAVLGAVLVRIGCGRSPGLVRIRGIAAFLLAAGPVSCVAVATLRLAAGDLPAAATAWSRQWAGDATGGLVVGPLVLALVGGAAWRPQARGLVAALALLAAGVAGLHHLAGRADEARGREQLDRVSEVVAAGLQSEERRLRLLLDVYHLHLRQGAGTSDSQQLKVRGRRMEFLTLFPPADGLVAFEADAVPPEYRAAVALALTRGNDSLAAGPGPDRFAVVLPYPAISPPVRPAFLGCKVETRKLLDEAGAGNDPRFTARLVDADAAAADGYPVSFAGRSLRLVVSPDPYNPAGRPVPYAWMASTAGLFGSALVAALLLSLTGQTAVVRAEVGRARAELSEVHRERAEAAAALQEARREAALGRLAGGVAHEFNNILTGIVGHAGRARESLPAGHPAGPELARVEEAVGRAAEVCHQALAFTGKGTAIRQPVDLGPFLTAVAADARPRLPHGPAVDVGGPAVTLTADAPLLRRLVTNLLLNAAEAYAGPGGRIEVRYGEGTDGGVWLSVADAGGGMPADVRDRAFEPFFGTKSPGRGLGLSAVRGIAQTHGGGVTLASEPGRGTCVTVRFANPPGVSDPTPPPQLGPPRAPAELRGGLVLVVDDDATVRELAAATLRAAGCEVLTAENGEEGLSLYRREADRVRLVVLDLLMPVMDGATALALLRRQAERLPVVVISAYSDFDLSGEFANGSPVAYLRKPFRPPELLATAGGLFAPATA